MVLRRRYFVIDLNVAQFKIYTNQTNINLNFSYQSIKAKYLVMILNVLLRKLATASRNEEIFDRR